MKQKDREIIEEFQANFKIADEYCKGFHEDFKQHYGFTNGPDGQWTEDEKTRLGEPIMQVNRLLAYGNQIVNNAVKQDIGCIVEPVSEGADLKLAKVRQAQIMKLWDLGKGKQVSGKALRHQVFGGYGVLTSKIKFANDYNMDKTLVPVAFKDPTTFSWDPSAKEPGRVDMTFACVQNELSKAGFESRYGEWKPVSKGEQDKWQRGDKKKIFEYWRLVKGGVTKFQDANGDLYSKDELKATPGLELSKDDDGNVVSRTFAADRVEQYVISNDRIVGKSVWPGCRLPFKVVEGREYYENDKMSFQSMLLAAENPQRKYNFIESQKAIMFSKGPLEMVLIPSEGDTIALTDKLNEASRNGSKNLIVIPYKSVDNQGNRIGTPQFKPQLLGDPILTQEGQLTIKDIEACIGMVNEGWLDRKSDASGIAIQRTEEQSETSSFDFIDNWTLAIEELFKDWIYIIPKLGISMQLKLAGEDLKDETIWVNNPKMAATGGSKNYDLDEDEEYSLTLKVGPSPKSMRDKSFDQMMQFGKEFPMYAPLIADYAAQDSLDSMHSEEIGARIQKAIAHQYPWALGQSGDPRVMAVQQQLQQAQQQMQMMNQQMGQMQQQAQQKVQELGGEVQTLKLQLQAEKVGNISDAAKQAAEVRIKELEAMIKQEELQLKQLQVMGEEIKLRQPLQPQEAQVVG